MDQYWLEVAVDTTPECLDDLAAYLTGCGIVGLVLESEADFDRQLEEGRPYWDDVDEELRASWRGISRVKFYVTQDEDGEARLAEVQSGLAAFRGRVDKDAGTLAVTTVSLREEDWANNWKQYYKPLTVGERLYIVPEWEKGETAIPDGRTALYLNPGLIFGTGTHASTQLCLGGVEEFVKDGDQVLDLGCGSGILSIAALLLGADHAVACDIDEKCMDVAYENAALNGVGRDRYTVRWGDVVTDQALRQELGGPYDVVVANIVADVIKALASTVRPLVKEGGIFLCSGIIDDRAEEVAQCLRDNGWTIAETRSSEGWFSYLCR